MHTGTVEKWWYAGCVRIIMLSMKKASDATASVSGLYNLINSTMKISLSDVIERDTG